MVTIHVDLLLSQVKLEAKLNGKKRGGDNSNSDRQLEFRLGIQLVMLAALLLVMKQIRIKRK